MRVILLASVLVFATALLLLFSSPPAQADGVVYVSNMGVSDGQSIRVSSISYAQAFKTAGPSTNIHTWGSIELDIDEAPADVTGVRVRLYSGTASSGPSAEICTLSNPSDLDTTGVKRFGAVAACSSLDGDTTYFAVMDYTSTNNPIQNGYKLQYANSGNEDSGAAMGWGINDTHWSKISGASWLAAAINADHVIKIRVRAANTAPAASNGTVDTDEGTAYTFEAGDFGFQDADNSDSDANNDDTLNHVKITSLPDTGEGTLWLDANDDDNLGDSEAVSVNDEVTKGNIDDGNLQYTPPASGTGNAFTSFDFKVNDGLDDSGSGYTMSINVSVALVSNTGQARNTNLTLSTRVNARAQAFTTGSNPKGYDLGSFTLDLADFQADSGNSTTTVSLYSSTSADLANPGDPDAELCTLVNPDEQGAGIYTFAAPASCGTMVKGAEYFVVVHTVVIDTNQPQSDVNWHVTASDSEDGTPSPGWSISNGSHKKNGNWAVILLDDAFKMKVNGAAIPNALPTAAVNATVTTDEDMTYTLTEAIFSLSDTNAADTLHAVITSLPDAGTLWFDVDGADDQMGNSEAVSLNDKVVAADLGKLKYTPPADANGTAFTTFGFKVNDGYEDSASGYTITVNVTPVNDAPEAEDDSANTDEDTAVDINVTANDADADSGATLSVTTVTTPSNGTAVIVSGSSTTVTYTPGADFNGTASFNYTLSDGTDTDTGTVTVTVTAVNDAPLAVDDTGVTVEDIPVNIDVLGNDTDVDVGTTLTVVADSVTTPSKGTTVISGGIITYTPNTGFAGIDTFTYTVTDGDASDPQTDTGTITVKVRPVVSGSTPSFAENGTGSVATYTAGGNPTWSLSGIDSDKFSIDSDGVLTFNSPPDFEDPSGNVYNVTVVATVGTGDDAVTGTLDVTVTVTDVNEPPTITSGPTTVVYAENGTAPIGTYIATDPEGADIYIEVSGRPDQNDFVVAADTGVVSFQSSPDFENPVDGDPDDAANLPDNVYEITVKARDGSPLESNTKYSVTLDVTVTVTNVNEAPVVTGPGSTPGSPIKVAENADTDAIVLGTYTATDPEGDTLTWRVGEHSVSERDDSSEFSFVDGSTVFQGKLYFASKRNFEDPKDDNKDNLYEFSLQADDESVTGTLDVTVRVTDANDAPVAVDDTYSTDEGTPVVIAVSDDNVSNDVLDNDTDEDANTTLSVTAVTDPPNGTAVLAIADGKATITYTPDTDTDTDTDFAGFDSFTYTVADGSGDGALTDTGAVTVSVAPVVSGSTEISYAENRTDPVETYTAGGSPTWRLTGTDRDSFSIDSGGVLTFNSPPDYESPSDSDTNNVYVVTVVATVQSGGSTVTVTKIVTVTVVSPTVTGSTQVDYAENGTVTVGTYTASGNPIWSLTGADSGAFSIDANSGALAFDSTDFPNGPNYETPADADTDNVYEVTVQATEGTGEDAVTASLGVAVTVTDLPVVRGTSGLAEISYDENATAAVDTYSATGTGGSISWSLLGADSGVFTFDSGTGVLTFSSSPDYENPVDDNTNNVYEVTVQATEGTEFGKLDVTVTVTDLLVVSGPAVSEYAENGTDAVGTYTASGSGGTISWSLEAIGDYEGFSIDANSGELTFYSSDFPNGPDYESAVDYDGDNEYEITVQVTEGSEVSTLDVTIRVVDLARLYA